MGREFRGKEERGLTPFFILALGLPLSILFSLTGMDFYGYFTSMGEYSRSLSNVLTGFALTTAGLLFLPLILNHFIWHEDLAHWGIQLGKKKLGLILLGIYFLLTPLYLISSSDPAMIATYPMAREALKGLPYFIAYELLYILFYYVPYEFFFRGFIQLGLTRSWKPWQSILLVTLLTTLLHITKPPAEIISAFVGGIVFGLIVEKTQSLLYVFIIHIFAGLMTDTLCSLYYLGYL